MAAGSCPRGSPVALSPDGVRASGAHPMPRLVMFTTSKANLMTVLTIALVAVSLCGVRAVLAQTATSEADAAELKKIAMRGGMKTLHQDSLLKVKEGLSTLEEAVATVPPDM